MDHVHQNLSHLFVSAMQVHIEEEARSPQAVAWCSMN